MADKPVRTTGRGAGGPPADQPLVWRNLACILLFEAAWGLSQGVAFRDTVMARYLDYLAMPSRVVAMLPAIFTLGLCVVQPLSAVMLQDTPGRARRLVGIYCLCGLTLSGMGLTVFLPESVGPAACAAAFLAVFVGHMCVMGFGEPHYIAIVYHTAPAKARGRVFASCLAMVGVGGIVGGWLARTGLAQIDSPDVFGWLLLASGVILTVGVLVMLFVDESRLAAPPAQRCTFSILLRQRTPAFLARPGFVLYVLGYAGMWILVTAPAFLTNYIRSVLPAESETIIGELTIVTFVVMTVGSLASGWLADRIGFRAYVVLGFLTQAAAYAAVATFPLSKPLALGLYATTALSWAVLVVGGTPILCSLVPDARVAELTAVMAVMSCLPRLAIPFALGWLRDATGSYVPLFWSLAGIACLSALFVWLAMARASSVQSSR